ncbi:MAG: class IV adenylate cyclase [Candidatus Acidiferrum sp.]
MAQEIEIKLKITDVKALIRALKRLDARSIAGGSGRVHEWNIIFDTPQGGLAKHGQLLRIRTETPELSSKNVKAAPPQRTLVTFKRPLAAGTAASGRPHERPRHKVREEIEVEVADAGVLQKIFEGLGMSGWFRYEKYRTTYRLPGASAWAKGLLIELDETPIGTFVELEGPPSAIDRAAQALGYDRRDYIMKSYLALYLENCRRQGREPKDMVFASSNPPAHRKKQK